MPELIQGDALPDVQVSGLPNPKYTGRDTSAEAGLAGNIAELVATEVDTRKKAKAAEDTAYIEQFIGEKVGGMNNAVAMKLKEMQDAAAKRGEEITSEQALAEFGDQLAQGGSLATNAEFVRAALNAPNMTNEEVEKVIGTPYFNTLRLARDQGAKSAIAIDLAAGAQVKALIQKYPQLADEIRKVAAREVGYDPAAEYNWRSSMLEPKKKENPSEYDKALESSLDALQDTLPPDLPENMVQQIVSKERTAFANRWLRKEALQFSQLERENSIANNKYTAQVAGDLWTKQQPHFMSEWWDETVTNFRGLAQKAGGIGEAISPDSLNAFKESVMAGALKRKRMAAEFFAGAPDAEEKLRAAYDDINSEAASMITFSENKDMGKMLEAANKITEEQDKYTFSNTMRTLAWATNTLGGPTAYELVNSAGSDNVFTQTVARKFLGIKPGQEVDLAAVLDVMAARVPQWQKNPISTDVVPVDQDAPMKNDSITKENADQIAVGTALYDSGASSDTVEETTGVKPSQISRFKIVAGENVGKQQVDRVQRGITLSEDEQRFNANIVYITRDRVPVDAVKETLFSDDRFGDINPEQIESAGIDDEGIFFVVKGNVTDAPKGQMGRIVPSDTQKVYIKTPTTYVSNYKSSMSMLNSGFNKLLGVDPSLSPSAVEREITGKLLSAARKSVGWNIKPEAKDE